MLHFCTLELVEYILIVQCQILIRAAVLGRLRLLSSQYFSWVVLTLRELVPLSRTGTSELTVREDVQPTGVVELHDMVLEEVAVLVGRVVLVPG